jgi:hypothetical protein
VRLTLSPPETPPQRALSWRCRVAEVVRVLLVDDQAAYLRAMVVVVQEITGSWSSVRRRQGRSR